MSFPHTSHAPQPPPLPPDVDAREHFRDDPALRQVRAAMQDGAWNQATSLLEALQVRYASAPDVVDEIEAMLAECRFKADFDREAAPRVKPRLTALNWRRLTGRLVMVAGVLAVVLSGVTVVRARVLPMMNANETAAQRADLLEAALNSMAAEDWTQAEKDYLALQALDPSSVEAHEGLAQIALEREYGAAYNAAERLLLDADYEGALKAFSDLQRKAPNYRDINSRILEVRKLQQLELLYEQAQTQLVLGYNDLALATLNEIQSVSTEYRKAEIQERLFRLNFDQGRAIVNQTPPNLAQLPVALDLFNAALRQRPSDADVLAQQRLLANFLAGRDAYDLGQWADAVSKLESVYTQQPGYLAGSVPPMLYQAYLNNGDQFRAQNDLYRAYDQYRLASELPGVDTVVALGRMAEIQPLLTPTPTPAPTLPPASPVPSATPTPTPTPRPMLAFQGRIVFKSDNPDAPGYYVMDATGGGREYLGSFELYDLAVQAYRETERISPDGQFRVQVGDVDQRPQVLLAKPYDPSFAPKPLTRLSNIAYDPVWAPDGSLVAFVTQENESDDIWVSSPDASVQEALMRNPWEWDKHPSWSPDSTRIAFMSNRDGTMGIWVMDRTGRNLRNISNTPWAEYEPVWVK